ncbi:amino acid adenylation domain-containing protein [Streptomyces rishiriensis]|uniref:amino acid adenylation domain-containing protein n=1 Tax=Streptomyces rishiriensis TaxID=68264 RepID=UPI0037A7354A
MTNTDALREELIRSRLAGRSLDQRGAAESRADRSKPLPLSFGQQGIWFLSRLHPDSPEYLVPCPLRLRGPLDTEALRAALEKLVARHEVLRTRYELSGTEPVQVIDAASPVALPVVNTSDATGHLERDARTPIDLEREHPLRARLLRLGAEEHVLSVVMHHIACDNWTQDLFVDELGALYREQVTGRPARLPEQTVQYADYATRQREHASGPELGRRLDHWRRALDGLTPLDLPTDHARTADRGWGGDQVGFYLPAKVTAALREAAARSDTTLFVVLLTAFQVLLARYSGQRDVAVGSAVAARTRPDEQHMLGYLQNTLVLRANWTDDPAFTELVEQGRDRTLAALVHQEVPLHLLTESLGGRRDLSGTSLFRVMFDLLDAVPTEVRFPGLNCEFVETANRVARFDLTLQLAARADGSLVGSLNYATALFDRSTAERMVGHFQHLSEEIARRPHARLSTLDVLGPGERHMLLASGDGGSGDRPWATVSDLVAHHARRITDAAAVVVADGGIEDTTISYAELDARANRVARYLADLGAGPETVVAVCLNRGAQLLPTLLGIWRAGAAYLPLDPEQPDERLRLVLDDSGARIAVTHGALVERIAAAHKGALVDLDRDAALIERCAAEPFRQQADPDSLAYVIYTSGSTGRPKGVLTTHRALMNYLSWAADTYTGEVDGAQGAPLISSVSFDLVVTTVYTPLLLGRPVYILPPDTSPGALGAALARHAPYDFVKLTPGQLELISQQLMPRQAVDFAGTLVVGGEGFPSRLATPWTHSCVINEYGPTEATVGNTTYVASGAESSDLLPIGRPLPGTTARVLDTELGLVPVGAVGELYVGGSQLARGYHGRPGLTAERFLPDPYGPPGARLYRTGDSCRVLPNGDLEFLGRTDAQLKIRGYRVEPAEIEAALSARPGVAAAVAALKDSVLVGYVVPEPGATPSAEELRSALEHVLPAYMLPSAFVTLEAIPLTANGKIDHRALPAPHRDDLPVAGYTAPAGETQEHIAKVWRSVLGLEEVGATDSFFDVGGDSLHAVALVGALRDEGLDLAVEDVFEHPTIAEIAELVSERPQSMPVESCAAPFSLLDPKDAAHVGAGVEDAYPLSMIQAGMVYEMVAGDGTHNYLNTTTYDIRDGHPFDLDAMREAAALVVSRHEVLRTSIDLTTYSEPMQLVHERARLQVEMTDLRGLGPDEQNQHILDVMGEERRTLFDLGQPSLLRIRAHVRDDAKWSLTITECHPILEGWSYHLFLMELLTYYQSLRSGQRPDVEELPQVRYADFIAAERAALNSEANRTYWEGLIGSVERFELPPAWAGTKQPDEHQYKQQVSFADLLDQLHAAARTAKVPLKSILHMAHLKVMSMLTQQEEFFTGLVCDARPEVLGAERVLGMFLNTVPFPFRLTARTWQELARDVFATETALWPHRRFPLPAIQRELSDGRRLIDVMFNYLDFRSVDEDLVDIYSTIDDSPNEFPLSVTVFRLGIVDLTFHSATIRREHGAQLAKMYRMVLEAIAADPDGDAQAAYVPAPVPAHRESAVPEGRHVHEIIADHARDRPEQAAVVSGPDITTYGRLDAEANRLAHHLRCLGAGPDTLVGVCLDGGPGMITALLGVLKTGAAYVPLDPSHPGGRLAHCLADSGAIAVVTREELLGTAFDDLPAHLVCLDRDGEQIAAWPDTPPPVWVTPDSLAYVIYTSGSTGRPKGVMVTHRGLGNYLRWAADHYGSAATRGAPLLGSIAFDLSVTNLFVPLVLGRDVELLPACGEVEALAERLRAGDNFTLVKATPSHLDMLRNALEATGETTGAVGAPFTFVIGGEDLRADTVAAWRRIAPAARFVNEYGPTETVVGCAVYEACPEDTGSVPIGRPIAGTGVHVLDTFLQPVPLGVAGEIFIGGAGVARGYLNRPALTAAAFLPDPYGPPGSRLYRSGDLGVLRTDGELEFLGRVDDQVKIRGYRIELGEIEARLRAHPGVRAAVVAARPDPRGTHRLVAYTVGDAAPADLTAFLRTDLPDYMVPRVYMRLSALPVGQGGKVDRGRLPEPEGLGPDRRVPYTAPATGTECDLAEVWATTLGLDRVGADDDFFDLGGDSILVMRAVAAARRSGLALSPRLVTRHRTVAAVAAALAAAEEQDAAPGRQGSAATGTAAATGELPPWPIQLAFAEEEAEFTDYTQVAHLVVDPAPDPALLEQALHDVVEHHDAMRMRLRDGRARIEADEPGRLLDVADLSGVPTARETDTMRDLVRRAAPDLTTGPAVRATLFEFGDGRPPQLAVAAHRLVVDGVSWQFLVADLATAYRRRVEGRRAVLPPKTTPFRTWAHHLTQAAHSEPVRRQLDHWLSRGAHVPVPPDRPGGSNTWQNVRSFSVSIGMARPPAGLRDALLAALLLTVTRSTGSDRLLVEVEGHGREDLFPYLDVSRTVGWFTTLYPVELRLPTGRDAVLDSVAAALRAVPDGGVGYGLLRYLGDGEHARALAALPQPQIRFNYTGWAPDERTDAGFFPVPGGSAPARATTGTRSRHFEIDASVHDGTLELIWAYQAELHEETTVRALAESHLANLTTILAGKAT